jgi:hypothetical protein
VTFEELIQLLVDAEVRNLEVDTQSSPATSLDM